jgi:hypothetical protein
MGCAPSDLYQRPNTYNGGKIKPTVDEKGFVNPSDPRSRNAAFRAVKSGAAIWVGAKQDRPTEDQGGGIWMRVSESTDPQGIVGGGGGKEPSAAELNIMLALLETVKIKDGKVNQAAESDIMQQVESPLNRQNMINIAKGKSNKAATAVKILRILFAINSAKNCFTAAEKREVKTIFQREGGVTRRVKRR